MIQLLELPHDKRNFVHKRIIGAVGGFIGGGPVGAAAGFFGGGGGKQDQRFQITDRSGGGPSLAQRRNLAATVSRRRTPCGAGFFENDLGQCIQGQPGGGVRDFFERIIPGGETGIVPRDNFGEAVIGAFGVPALQPEVRQTTRMRCPAGMVLGRDELCYPKSVLRRDSKFRKWRPGPRPLLSGGKRKAIRTARAAILEVKEVSRSLGVTVPKKC